MNPLDNTLACTEHDRLLTREGTSLRFSTTVDHLFSINNNGVEQYPLPEFVQRDTFRTKGGEVVRRESDTLIMQDGAVGRTSGDSCSHRSYLSWCFGFQSCSKCCKRKTCARCLGVIMEPGQSQSSHRICTCLDRLFTSLAAPTNSARSADLEMSSSQSIARYSSHTFRATYDNQSHSTLASKDFYGLRSERQNDGEIRGGLTYGYPYQSDSECENRWM